MSTAFIFGGLALGGVVGVVSGLIGLGGGILIIPALIYFYGMTQKQAQGTSVATLLLPVGVLAFWKYYQAGETNLKLALLIAVGFTVGGYFGGAWAQHFSDTTLRRGFAILIVLIGAKLFFQK